MIPLHAAIEDRRPEFLVSSYDELETTITAAHVAARAVGKLNVIFLYAQNRDHVMLVVGGDETVVGFNHGHGDPPYYVSRGAAHTDTPVLTAYVGLAHHTEFERRWVVSSVVGRAAARQFLATGKRPTVVNWMER